MGFALWMLDGQAIAQGTHEYRPMGTAIIARTQLFRPRDFSRRHTAPSRKAEGFQGLFGSLEDLNGYLRQARSQQAPDRWSYRKGRLLPII